MSFYFQYCVCVFFFCLKEVARDDWNFWWEWILQFSTQAKEHYWYKRHFLMSYLLTFGWWVDQSSKGFGIRRKHIDISLEWWSFHLAKGSIFSRLCILRCSLIMRKSIFPDREYFTNSTKNLNPQNFMP